LWKVLITWISNGVVYHLQQIVYEFKVQRIWKRVFSNVIFKKSEKVSKKLAYYTINVVSEEFQEDNWLTWYKKKLGWNNWNMFYLNCEWFNLLLK